MNKIIKVKTVRFNKPLDKLISIVEYSIFIEDQKKYAEVIIYNTSNNTVYNFEMKIESYDENNIKLSSSILSIDNIQLRPNLYLKLKTRIPLPYDANGFNFSTISINKNVDEKIKENQKNIQNISSNNLFVTSNDQIHIGNLDVNVTKVENIYRKKHLKPRKTILVPTVGLAIALLTTIYFDVNVKTTNDSPTRAVTYHNYQISERRDFDYSVSYEGIFLNKYKGDKKMLYFDPSVYIKNYSGQLIRIQPRCFENSDLQRIVIQGNCEIGNSSFSSCKSLEAFICVNYTIGNIKVDGTVNQLDHHGFSDCENLKTFSCDEFLPNTISDYSFANCRELYNYVLPDSITVIGSGAFYGCKNLPNKFIFSENLLDIKERAFLDSSIKEVTFNNNETRKATDSFNSGVSFNGSSIYDNQGKEIIYE